MEVTAVVAVIVLDMTVAMDVVVRWCWWLCGVLYVTEMVTAVSVPLVLVR